MPHLQLREQQAGKTVTRTQAGWALSAPTAKSEGNVTLYRSWRQASVTQAAGGRTHTGEGRQPHSVPPDHL